MISRKVAFPIAVPGMACLIMILMAMLLCTPESNTIQPESHSCVPSIDKAQSDWVQNPISVRYYPMQQPDSIDYTVRTKLEQNQRQEELARRDEAAQEMVKLLNHWLFDSEPQPNHEQKAINAAKEAVHNALP